ncbi:hypothetical protein ScPMuIL_014612 [Solemya velum]
MVFVARCFKEDLSHSSQWILAGEQLEKKSQVETNQVSGKSSELYHTLSLNYIEGLDLIDDLVFHLLKHYSRGYILLIKNCIVVSSQNILEIIGNILL